MTNNTQEKHRHVLHDEDMTPYQRFVHKALTVLLELTTMELLIAIIHCLLTAIAVFGLAGVAGGEGGH